MKHTLDLISNLLANCVAVVALVSNQLLDELRDALLVVVF
jgi:hypothetical protein